MIKTIGNAVRNLFTADTQDIFPTSNTAAGNEAEIVKTIPNRSPGNVLTAGVVGAVAGVGGKSCSSNKP